MLRKKKKSLSSNVEEREGKGKKKKINKREGNQETARLPMSPGPITVKRRLLYTRTCFLSFSFCLFKACGDVYLRLCVCFCRSVTQLTPQMQGNQVFELFLNHYDHPSSAEKEAFLQGGRRR